MSVHGKSAIFIDGANVAKECHDGKTFSVVGLLRCAVYFRHRDYVSKIILNRNYRALAASGRLDDGDQLTKLENAGIVVYTPVGSDEKEFLVQLALDHGGVIVSNDEYKKEKEKRQDWARFLHRRCLPFRVINNEFVPTPPSIDGRVLSVTEFLDSPYEFETALSSASALTNYLLMMKIDDHRNGGGGGGDSPNDGGFGGQQRFRHNRNASGGQLQMPPMPQRRYTVGKIVDVKPEIASVEFHINKEGDAVLSSFNRDAYHPIGRPVHDLSREFRAGDWIGFISVKNTENGERRWSVMEVRKKGEMRRGYGRFRPLNHEAKSGTIEARYKSEAGGGDVFFPGAAFRDEGTLLENLTRGHWLYYYAFDQKPSAGCTAVAVEVSSATTSGVIIKKTDKYVYVWSTKTGVARGDVVRFPEGTWVKFRFQQKTERGVVQWVINDVEIVSTPGGVTIETEQMEGSSETVVHVRCPAVAGIITESYGSIWSEAFGRMNLSAACLKHIRNVAPAGLQPYQPIRLWAIYNNDHHRKDEAASGGEEAAASSVRPKSTSSDEPWRVISLIAASGASAAGADPPYPPPSIIFGVEATVMDREIDEEGNKERGPHWILGSEKYGKIFVTPHDLSVSQKSMNLGDRVKTSIVPQALSFGDEYRALIVEKLPPPLPTPTQVEELAKWKF